jgi:hypothetical protein
VALGQFNEMRFQDFAVDAIKVRAVFVPIFDINSLKQTAVRDIE